MKVTKFIKKKNKILRKHLGLPFNLVPKTQIEECDKHRLSAKGLTPSCPYCLAYSQYIGNCDKCPMAIAGNECCDENGSTFEKYMDYCYDNDILDHSTPNSPAYKPMKELIAKYNKGIK